MKKITLLFIAAFTFTALFSQSLTTSYVNGYKILKGERPEINVRDFPVDAYQQGKIKIKIDKSYEEQLPDIMYWAEPKEFVKTGVSGLDALNAQFQAVSYTPLFGTLYETNSKSSVFRERHKAWGFHLWFTIELDENVAIADAVEAYQALPFVEIAEPFYNTVLHDADKMTEWSSNDPRLGDQWHYNNTGQVGGTPGCDVSLFQAWEIEKGYDGVIVSVVDCGIQANHPDLEGNMWSQIGYNFYQNTATISAGDHGCHTGGTIAAVTNNGTGVAGVAGGSGSNDGVRLMTCQVFNSAGSSGSGFQNAYVYAADNGACISQNSWGYTSPNSYEQSVLTAIDYFLANGGGNVMEDGIVIFSSGNNNNYPYNGLEGNYYPGYYAPVLGVTATNNQDKKASYAHYGTWVGISAPGGETGSVTARGVLSCIRSNYAYYQGTSMACPHVSGAAALLVSYAAREEVKLSREEVKSLLLNNADDHYDLNPSYIGKLGTGRLNIYKALLALKEVLNTVKNPDNVSALPVSYSEIELHWQQNTNENPVMILTNLINEFGKPEDSVAYQVGDQLPEGGEVIYIGDAETFLHSGLTSRTTYYYKFFAYNETYIYSKGVETEAMTLCGIVESPVFEYFEDGIDFCWEQEYVTGNSPWLIGKGNNESNPDYAYEGAYNVYFKAKEDFSDVGNTTRLISPTINMTNFNNVKLSFAFYNETRSGITDEFSVYYKTSELTAWILWKEYKNNQDNWLLDTIILPENVNTNELSICFQGNINGGYGICLDNISLEGFDNLGTKDNNLDKKITVYPNPTTGELRVTSYELQIGKIEIFDVYGRNVGVKFPSNSLEGWQPQADGVVLNISHLPAGIYFLRVNGETIKVVKE